MKQREGSIITTGDVAAHCHVTYETVKNWIKQGKLKAFETPGRHHRIHIKDFNTFLETYGMPRFYATGARRILVVDDQAKLVKSLVEFLTRAGYECASASDGFEAGLQVVSFQPDLVVLDLIMPNIDGFEVCRKIKSDPETKRIIVLAITGEPQEDNLTRIKECGADDILLKPFKPEKLLEHIQALFKPRTRPPQKKRQQATS